ncbi:hypothetical protein M3C17_10065, partial [Microbacterium sp. p3-SID336]|nr:hypothetical protein [Microbacterium sp. p3-SID336]
STVEVPSAPAPAITVVKSATPSAMTTVGQMLTYSFVVTNDGNVALKDVTVDETEFSGEGELSSIECPDDAANLLPGQVIVCTATYTTTQGDVDSGLLTNTATATGVPPAGAPPVSPPSTVDVPFDGATTLGIEKRATTVDVNRNGVADLGDRIEWSILVTNTGAQTIDDITVSDPAAGTVTCPTTTLASGETMTCTVPTHSITAADVSRGEVWNVATASGNAPNGDPVDPPSARAVTPVVPTPASGLAVTGGTVSGGVLIGVLMLSLGALLLPGARRRKSHA